MDHMILLKILFMNVIVLGFLFEILQLDNTTSIENSPWEIKLSPSK